MFPTTAGSSCCKSPLAAAAFCQLAVPLLQVLTDLLNPEATHLLIREDVKKGIFVENLSSHVVHNSTFLARGLRPCHVFPWRSAPAAAQSRQQHSRPQRRLIFVCLPHPAVGEVAALLEQGQLNRKIGETMMNSESSRSHSVFTAVLECKTTDDSGITHVLSSRLNLVDLAGAWPVAPVCCQCKASFAAVRGACPWYHHCNGTHG